jgi:hypothetical protein
LQEKVYKREEWKNTLRTARNHRILHMPMEWMSEWMNEWKNELVNDKLGNIWIVSRSDIFSVYWLILKTISNVRIRHKMCQSYLKHILFQQMPVFRTLTLTFHAQHIQAVFVCVNVSIFGMCYKY